jgi:hypothetical protein
MTTALLAMTSGDAVPLISRVRALGDVNPIERMSPFDRW